MHKKFLDILRCPITGSDLKMEVIELFDNGLVKTGTLVSNDGKYRYPIISGIPRFVEKEFYTSSFGFEWKKWSRVQFEDQNLGTPMEGHTKKMFDSITNFTPEEVEGKLVVEFGCGPGRFLDIVRKYGGIAIGLDLSLAVESARENFKEDENVLIVQGDILNPPFKEQVFDAGYSLGVLHHTPDPKQGFKSLVNTIKNSGRIGVSVYSSLEFYNYPSVHFTRFINKLVKPLFGNNFALYYSKFSANFLYHFIKWCRKIPLFGKYFAYFLNRYVIVNAEITDARWRFLDNFDAITPVYASTHTGEEVQSWFKQAECYNLRLTNWGNTSMNANVK